MSRPATPRRQLLWDENLSPVVPKALRTLGYRTTHIGGPGAPARKSQDPDIVPAAISEGMTIVTADLTMVLACATRNTSVVWHDTASGSNFREMVLRAFTHIDDWCRHLDEADRPVCVHALKTKTNVMSLDEAIRKATGRRQRTKARASRQRRKPDQAPLLDGL